MGMKECYICEKHLDEDELHDHFVDEHWEELINHMRAHHLVDITSEMAWECSYVYKEDIEREKELKQISDALFEQEN